jgi:hypothetical protein
MISFKQYIVEYSHTSKEIRPYLEKKGYKFLGKGVDQSAYLEPKTGYVLKIFGTQKNNDGTNYTEDQKMFKVWVDYCTKNKTNKFLPKFFGWETFEYDDKKYLQIRMETYGKIHKHVGLAVSYLGYAINGGWIKQPDFFKAFDRDTFEQFNLSKEEIDGMRKLVISIGFYGFEKLWKTLQELSDIRKKNGYGWDLHNENFMYRNDGTPVIVDPWVLN